MSETYVTDEQVVSLVKEGDTSAFRLLVERYQEKIYGVTCKTIGPQDALDITQEIFVKAFKGLRSFRQESSFSTWIYRIMLNTLTTYKRKAARSGHNVSMDAGDFDMDDRPHQNDAEAVDVIVTRERIEAVRDALSRLEEFEQKLILLRDFDGKSYAEIVELVDMPLGTVKSRLHRARMALRDKLKRYMDAGDRTH